MNKADREILDKLQLDITEIKQILKRIMYSVVREKYNTDRNPNPYEPIERDTNPFGPRLWKERDIYQD